ncbi:TRAP transporter small permease subunit [Allopusillimonas soli]|uniref:TRAP transporter small permease protein n=1 Tax=Allopusillimonas soli TaxID=659016 RepID=A0A853FC07_9BURK|nr:TRAP transporter small permease subunit [Allopusillimonas soli]NYT36081.1 TRAP transporter small permease subunit [Allopusillimonas soli]TEA76418.1 TRAP transporter small permease subunit [Allopusillimonas soli]
MLSRIWKALDARLEEWLIVACYMYLVLIILVEVARRYAFGDSSEWGEMTARYAFVFLVYVSTAHISKHRNHIRVDLLPSTLSDKGRFWLYLYFDLLNLILVALTVYYSVQVMKLQIENDTLMTGLDLNMAFAQAALPVGFLLLGYRVIQRSLIMIREYRATGVVALDGGAQSV